MPGSGSPRSDAPYGPQRGLFFGCLALGLGSLLALDLYFAPAALSARDPADDAADAGGPPPASPSATAPAARVVIPAPARVPTIVARFDSASTEPSDQTAIRALATAMIEDHDVTIVLEGHSDTRGGDDYNHTISLDRANWVKARLVALGVSPERIETVGLGATRPLRSDDLDGPSVNRRVEVRWLGSAAREGEPPRAARVAPSRDAGRPRVRGAADAGDADRATSSLGRADGGATTASLAALDAGAPSEAPARDAGAEDEHATARDAGPRRDEPTIDRPPSTSREGAEATGAPSATRTAPGED